MLDTKYNNRLGWWLFQPCCPTRSTALQKGGRLSGKIFLVLETKFATLSYSNSFRNNLSMSISIPISTSMSISIKKNLNPNLNLNRSFLDPLRNPSMPRLRQILGDGPKGIDTGSPPGGKIRANHQLIWRIYQLFIGLYSIHLRWFYRRISEASTRSTDVLEREMFKQKTKNQRPDDLR